MREAELKKRIRVIFSRITRGVTFCNPVGIAFTGDLIKQNNDIFTIKGRKITYGLGRGTPDLIGIRPVIITPEMVGKKMGQFVGIETKNPNWKFRNTEHEKEQLKHIELINNLGGLAGFVKTEDDLSDLLSK